MTYEIDLSDENALALRTAITPYVDAGRPTSTAKRALGARRRSSTQDLDAVRAWARENGHTVSDRGRIPVAIQNAFDAR